MNALGTTNDEAVITDAVGTISAKLRGVVKLLAESGTAAIDNVLGAIDDAAVITDAAGTVTAKLRGAHHQS